MQVRKAYEISDAKIQFVSLVDKPANKNPFLITKAENDGATFTIYGKILKVDSDAHYITGIVYEPMKADTDDNYMTADEIVKAAHWFMKNSALLDIQHSFEDATPGGIVLVESWVTPCDMAVGEQTIVKGTWLITAEVKNDEVWDAVQKGTITGFSMGGIGKYSKEDVDLENVNKAGVPATAPSDEPEKKGLLTKLAALFGMDIVEKGEMLDEYKERMKSSGFWNAFYTLEDILYGFDWHADKWTFETDEATIREALEEFSAIMLDVLASQNIVKSLSDAAPINKAGERVRDELETAQQSISKLRDSVTENETIKKEDTTLGSTEKLQEAISESVTKAMAPILKALEAIVPITADDVAKGETPAPQEGAAPDANPAAEAVTKEDVAQMIEDGVADGVAKALEPILKRAGIATNLNDEEQVVKSDQHYLAGII